ncbi:hypothetical protein GOARA_042_00180 [Gordonia araii NBRC 100433]|uniref:Uncharacterized protein n=1 Tax=Gordonia araii NBRC 100433 TaxID=1073574 RepID=G7H0Y6_9ACTN|nr:hypothetical protein [Gordonia araii]NNG97306.1 hypothetical protein [Gordonia araii NBRC 100433]GAB09511.1 hypothetical protein GOARA_042_00180 [Gordonia araii NBRC 100433]
MQTLSGPAVRPSAARDPELDRALAAVLVADGRAKLPESPEWEAELLTVMATARRRLETSASVFLMGDAYVALILVTRDDLAAVTSRLAPAPDNVASRHRKGRGERPVATPAVGLASSWETPVPGPDDWVQERSAEFSVLDDVRASPLAYEPAESPWVEDESGLESDGDIEPVGGSRRELSRPARLALTIGAAATGILLGIGAIVFLAAKSDDGERRDAGDAPAPAPPSTTVAPDPVLLREVGRPAATYTPPTTAAENNAPQRSRRSSPPPPRGRWLPNPIPGLPPIRLP